MISIDTPENIRKPAVFWYFLGVSKEISDMKWVNGTREIWRQSLGGLHIFRGNVKKKKKNVTNEL